MWLAERLLLCAAVPARYPEQAMPSSSPDASAHLPPIDERLVVPESSFEMDDGRLVYVSPADPPHAIRQSLIAALLHAHVAADFQVAVEMLTRTTRTSDQAPDASVFPRAPDPVTGRRQLEHLAFEVVSTQRWSDVTKKARRLAERGVRRVFAIDVNDECAYEWSSAAADWRLLDPAAAITDPALAVALPIEPLISAVDADDSMAQALRAKRHPEFLAEREEGREEGRDEGLRDALRKLLVLKFGELSADTAARIAAASPAELDHLLERVLVADSLAAVFT